MAQLKDTTITGNLLVTDTNYSTTSQFQILRVPTTSGGTSYGPGTNKQVLKTNGTSAYWGADEVLQQPTTANAAYELLFSASANNNALTESVQKTSTLTYNPSTKALITGGSIDGHTLGEASEKSVTDNTADSDVTNSNTQLITGRTLYYQLNKIGLYSQNANLVLAGPTSGSIAARPSFRALVAADLPPLSTFTSDNGSLPVANGGTGVASYPALDAELKTVAVAISNDTNPFTLDPGTYYLSDTTYSTSYYPQASLTGTMVIHQIGTIKKTATIIDSDKIFYGFGDSTSDTVFTWHRTLQAYDENAIYRFTLEDSSGVNGIQLIKDDQGGKLYIYGKDGHTFWFDSYANDAPLRLVTMGTDSNYKIWQFSRGGGTTLPGVLTVGAQNTTSEGGQITLAAAPDYGTAAALDVYQNTFRVVAGSSSKFTLDLSNGNITTGLINGLYATSINTESSIATTKTAVYTGSGTAWTGSVSTMAYAAILHVGEGMSRGFDIWAVRADKLYWRAGNSDMTAWFAERAIIDSNGGDITGHTIFSTPTAGNTYAASGSAIQIREVNRVAGNQTDWTYAPKIGFHWSNKAALQLGMDSSQWLQLYANNSTTHGNMALGKVILDGTNALRFVGGTGNTKSMLFRNDGTDFYLLCCNAATDGDNWYTPTSGAHPLRVNLLSGITYLSQVSIANTLVVSGDTTVSGIFKNDNINASTGAGMLAYKPTNWSGVSNTQWGLGATDCQGIIRSSNTNLIHYKGGTNYTILDTSQTVAIANGGTGATSATTALSNLGGLATTGGTMTGSLTVTSPAAIILKSPTINYTANPSSNLYNAPIYFQEKNGNTIGQIDTAQYTNGQTALRILLYNYDTSGNRTVLDGPYIYATRAGVISYRVPNVSAFRNAIGIFFTSKTVAFSNNAATITFNQNAYLINAYAVATDKLIYFYRSSGQTQYTLYIRHKDTSGSSTTFSGNVTIDLCYFSESAATIT